MQEPTDEAYVSEQDKVVREIMGAVDVAYRATTVAPTPAPPAQPKLADHWRWSCYCGLVSRPIARLEDMVTYGHVHSRQCAEFIKRVEVATGINLDVAGALLHIDRRLLTDRDYRAEIFYQLSQRPAKPGLVRAVREDMTDLVKPWSERAAADVLGDEVRELVTGTGLSSDGPISPTEVANFVVCSGGCGKELVLPVGGQWTCSVECWRKAITPPPPIARPVHAGIIGPGDHFVGADGSEHVTVRRCGGGYIHFSSYDGLHTGSYSPEMFFEAYPTRVTGAATSDRVWCTDCGHLVQIQGYDACQLIPAWRAAKCCPDHWRQRQRAQAMVASLLTEDDMFGRPE